MQAWLIGASIVAILVEIVVNLVGKLVALFEAGVVGADEYNAEVELLKTDVDVKHVLLGTAWYANRCPCLTVSH